MTTFAEQRFRELQVKAIAGHLADVHGLRWDKAAAVAACLAPWIDGSQATPGCVEPALHWQVSTGGEREP